MDKQEEISRLEEELKISVVRLGESLSQQHTIIDENFYKIRENKIQNLKSYLTNIALVCATIIPFSSLVFQIPAPFKINIFFWIASLLAFITSLVVFISSFLSLINTEKDHHIKIVLAYVGSGFADFTLSSNKNDSEKLTELVDVLKSQEEFNKESKAIYTDKDLISLIKDIQRGSWIFIGGLCLFFISIIFNTLISSIYSFMINLWS